MAKIILNNEEFDFQGYNRNTYFNNENLSSNAYISGLNGENLNARLVALAQTTIGSLIIKNDDKVIYSLENIHAKVMNIDENFNGTDMININLNLQFD